jgi:DNA-binding SARP family transcriptional activator
VSGLSLRLFGVLQLEENNERAIRLTTKKTAALLAYLALHSRQPQSRAKLAALFWEDSGEPQARESLRQTLSLLRKALGPNFEDCLLAQGDNVLLELSRIPVDTAQFEELAGRTDAVHLDQAARLYRGQVLEGFDLRAPEFEVWLRSIRQAFHEKALDVLTRLLSQHLAAGNHEGGVTVATRLLALDPLREDAHRILIELYSRQGRHAAALQQYRYCEEVLMRELGIEPEAATRALYRRVRDLRDHAEHHTSLGPQPTILPSVAPVFVPRGLERRPITAMSCGLLGLAQLSARLDPEEVHALATACRRRCHELTTPYGGVVGPLAGDDLTVYFGLREASEHNAEQALRAALSLIEALPRLGAEFSAAINPRIGIATSPLVVGQFSGGAEPPSPALLGEAPKKALLLQSAAEPGSIVISGATRALIGDLFAYRALPPIRISGGEEVEGWQVLGEAADVSRFEATRASRLTPFTGRTAELEQLLTGWREARSGSGRAYLITGDPGIGKSRLTRMCCERVDRDRQRTLFLQCSPFHTESVLFPFIRQLEQAAGFAPEDSPAEKLAKLEAQLSGTSWRVTGLVGLLAELLSLPTGGRYTKHGLTPAQQRRKTMAALLDWIENGAHQGTMLIVLEDAHWADASSLELLDQLVERIVQAPVLLLVTARPGVVLPWDCLDHVRKLPLAGLDDDDAGVMIRRIGGEGRVPQDVLDQIAARTDGVPLFLEELTRATLEAGASIRPAAQMAQPARLDDIPATLQDSLAARLDRLGPARSIAQTASVIGREFSPGLLAAMMEQKPEELQPRLSVLRDAGLVQEDPAGGSEKLAFKHALVQEAAYRSLPKSRRRLLHASAASAIEAKFPAEAETRPEVLAHHYTEAGMVREALGAWLKAGRLAIARSANVEAGVHLAKGLEVIKSAGALPSKERQHLELQLLITLGPAAMAVHGYASPEAQRVFERARDLIDDTTSDDDRMQVISGLWTVRFDRADLSIARELAFELLRIAERTGRGVLRAHCVIGQTLSNMGEFEPARDHLRFVIDAYEEQRRKGDTVTFGVDELILALASISSVLWALGDPYGAARTAKEAADRAHDGMNAVTTAAALLAHLYVATHSRALEDAQALGDQALSFCRENDLQLYGHWVRIEQGTLQVKQGLVAEGIKTIENGIAACEKLQSRLFRPFQLGSLAKAYLKLGDPERALLEADGAIAMADITGERQAEVGLRRLRCGMLKTLGRQQEAEEEFARAVALAQRQGAVGELARLSAAKR